MLSMTRYGVNSERLTPWVKFIWHFQDADAEVHSKLLPTDSIDMILNLGDKMTYEVDGHQIDAPPFHINGLRSGYSHIHQRGRICIYGISLHPYGLYPFIHKPVNGIQDQIVGLEQVSLPLYRKLRAAIVCGDTSGVIRNVEAALCEELAGGGEYRVKAKLIHGFINGEDSLTLQQFCAQRGMNIKTVERLVRRYTGYTPKMLRRVYRFQLAANQLVHQNPGSLADLAYANSYADQAHFIKEFRRFSGAAPRGFQQEKASVKENVRYNYL